MSSTGMKPSDKYYLEFSTQKALYKWVENNQPYSRAPKKSIMKQFSDGVLCAEFLKKLMPRGSVELNFYHPASAMQPKIRNWKMLNNKVFIKLGFQLPDDLIDGLVKAKDGYLAYVLHKVRKVIFETEAPTEEFVKDEGGKNSGPPTKLYAEHGFPDQIENAEVKAKSAEKIKPSGEGKQLSTVPLTSIASNKADTNLKPEAMLGPVTLKDAQIKNKILLHETEYFENLLKFMKQEIAEKVMDGKKLKAELEELTKAEIKIFGYC